MQKDENLIDKEQLAKRAVACKAFRWMPGMCDARGDRVIALTANEHIHWADLEEGMFATCSSGLLRDTVPDLTDPATIGCLLALVREACEPNRAPGDWPMVCTYQSQAKKWGVGAWLNESGKATFAAVVLPTYDTEAAALVAALEAVRAN